MDRDANSNVAPDDFCVIAAVNDDHILEQCLARSPDIADGALPLITYRGAQNMAEAYNYGLDQTEAPICVFAHQDVYLPKGWLDRAVRALKALTDLSPHWMAAGPYGVTTSGVHVGRVWDVTMGLELGQGGIDPLEVGSFDELLLLVRRDSGFRFDPELPSFHLYGTDLAQTAKRMGRTAWVVDLPVVHNNRPIVSLGGGYAEAYRYMRRKWQAQLPIPTTICALSDNPLSLWRARWRRRGVKDRGGTLLADAAEIARRAGYE